jgi:RNA polymerase sigma-70 factor, ECF subfamily
MLETERNLLQRMADESDVDAFSEIMHHYAHLAYGASHRILRDEALAADVVQETFLYFLQNASRITESLASWLHRVATCRAIDRLRQEASRRRREQSYAAEHSSGADPWHEIEPLVDEALLEMPEDLRNLLVWHYLEGRTLTQIATANGMSQPTASRRLTTALEQMRYQLRKKGVAVTSVALSSILASSVQAAPAALMLSLGKLALAQATSAIAGPVIPTAALLTATQVKTALAGAALLLLGSTGWFLSKQISTAPNLNQTTTAVLAPIAHVPAENPAQIEVSTNTLQAAVFSDSSSGAGSPVLLSNKSHIPELSPENTTTNYPNWSFGGAWWEGYVWMDASIGIGPGRYKSGPALSYSIANRAGPIHSGAAMVPKQIGFRPVSATNRGMVVTNHFFGGARGWQEPGHVNENH